MAEVALTPVVVRLVARWIPTEGKDIANASGGIAAQNLGDFLLRVPDTGEVGNGWDRRARLHAENEIVGELTSAAARTIGDGDEGRVERFKFADGLVKILPSGGTARGEKFKRERGFGVAENIADVHGG